MLSLGSPRWQTFGSFSGLPERLPPKIENWQKSIGTREEDDRWRELWESILHQGSITEGSYAAIPYVVSELHRIEMKDRLEYLLIIGNVDLSRQTQLDDLPECPSDLKEPYDAAIRTARAYSIELLGLEWPKLEFRYLMGIIASLHGHGGLGGLLEGMDTWCGECPSCGEAVYPEEVQNSGYV